MFDEDDFLPLSALQHMLFCERQAALIHVEGIWIENALTVEGRALHTLVDQGRPSSVEGVLVRRGLALRSARLVLSGKADVVEFHHASEDQDGIELAREEGRWFPRPVEYKRGRPKSHRADEVQLCAQALCLEEMLGVVIREGDLFYGQTRRRQTVVLDQTLRGLTEATAERLHEMVRARRTPVCDRMPKCDRCSLEPACLPPGRRRPRTVRTYLEKAWVVPEHREDV